MERDLGMGPALRNRVDDDDDDDDDTDDEELLVEEREAEMVSFLNPDRVAKRKAWFLASTGNVSKTTPLVPSNYKSASSVAVEDPKFQFKGWCSSPRQWEQWVAKLLPKFGQTWKKAGIFEAILISTYKIRRDPTSISALISNWCDETNTFIFPWGEVTVTLEDIIILSGLSVLGEPVKSPIPAEMMEVDQRLNDERLKFNRSTSKKAHHSAWMKVFMERDSDELEHAAFLSLWLSRFVFPCHPEMTIRPHVFPIAIRLSYGQRIALAPSVLASIYRDLREMKRCLVNRSSGMKDGSLVVWAPFHILQIWIWERFPGLRPETQNLVKDGEPRAARWHDVGKKLDLGLVQSVLSTPSSFQYRPYAISSSNWYKEGCVELIRDNELRSFAQCLCTCELVGIDTIEQYLPNRVAMQFGFDQDLPDPFSRVCHLGWEAAWRTYEITADNIGLYVPPQPFEPGISVNYLSWWREYMLACCNSGIVGMGGGMPHIMGSRENSKGKNKSGSKKARVSSPGDKKRKIQDCYNSTVSDSVESKACDIHEVGAKGTKGAKSLSHRLSFEDMKDVIGDGSGFAPDMSNPTEVIMETGGDIPSQVSDSVEDGRVIAFMEMKSITGDVLKKVIKEDNAIKQEKVTDDDDKRNKEQASIDRSEGSHPLQLETETTQTVSSGVTSGGPKIMPSLSVSITQSVHDANTKVNERIAGDLNLTPTGEDIGSSGGLIQVSVQGLSQAIKTSNTKVKPGRESEGNIELDGREQEMDSHQNVRKETIPSKSLNAELSQKEEKKQGEVGENKAIELDLLTNCGRNEHRDRNTNNDESLVEASEEKNPNNPENDKQIDRPLAPVSPESAENNTDMAMNEDREGYVGLHLQTHPSRIQGKGSRERISSRAQPPGPADAAAPSTLGGISKDRSGMPAVHGRTSTGVSSMDRYAAELRMQRANKEAKELTDIKKLKQEIKDMKHSIMMMEEGPSPS